MARDTKKNAAYDSGLRGQERPRETIDSAAVHGESGTGFEKAGELGEFECGNCSFFDGESCGQPDMMAKSQQPRNEAGRVQVEEEDCCEYVDRVGRKDGDEDDENEDDK